MVQGLAGYGVKFLPHENYGMARGIAVAASAIEGGYHSARAPASQYGLHAHKVFSRKTPSAFAEDGVQGGGR